MLTALLLCCLAASAVKADQFVNDDVVEKETVLDALDFERAKYVPSRPREDGSAVDAEYNEHRFEGDIIVPGLKGDYVEAFLNEGFTPAVDDRSGVMHNAIRSRYQLWNDRKVPYTLSSRYSSRSRATIAAAMDEYARKTCVQFVPRNGERDYLYIAPDDGCYSLVGKTGGRQIISLDSGCIEKGVIIHEMMHTLGFFHEQSRTDRDTFIEVVWSNIRSGLSDQFEKYSQNKIQHLGADYDYSSIMHYGRTAFTRNGRDTIRPRRSGASIGQRTGFSSTDTFKINKLYQCDGPSGVVTPEPSRPKPPSPSGGGGGGGNEVCVDVDADCRIQKRFFNACNSPYEREHMRAHCAKTCEFCNPSPTTNVVTTGDCEDRSSSCDMFASFGMCDALSMIKRMCQRACNTC